MKRYCSFHRRSIRKRLEAMHGKAMVVCMSRRICIDLCRELVRLCPEWHGDDAGACKVG